MVRLNTINFTPTRDKMLQNAFKKPMGLVKSTDPRGIYRGIRVNYIS